MALRSRRDFMKSLAAGALAGWTLIKHSKAGANEVLRGDGSTYDPTAPRRHVLSGSVLRGATPLARPLPNGFFPILQGATSQNETQFRILIETHKLYRYSIIDSVTGQARLVNARARNGVSTAQKVVDHLFVDGLSPDRSYWLQVEDPLRGSVVDRRQFSTLPSKTAGRAPLRVALISCMNDRYVNDQAEMWDAVAMSMPELMIFNGDLCYVDQRSNGSIEGMWARQVLTREMLDVFRWDRLVPILCTWDDHDTGDNDSNGTNPRLDEARDYFNMMFGSTPVQGCGTSPGMSHSFDIAGMRFVFLDGRSSRRGDRVFSSQDESWIEERLQSAPGPVCLINGMQFFGGYLMGAESVEKYAPAQLTRIMQMGRRAQVPVLLMSGDVHFSELMKLEKDLLGYASYEFTSSSLHSRTFPGQQFRSYNERRIESTSRFNYMAIDMEAVSAQELKFDLVCLGAQGEEFFRHKGKVKR